MSIPKFSNVKIVYFATSYFPVKLFKAFMNEGVKQVSGLLVFMSPQGNFYNSRAETRHFKAEIQPIAIFWGFKPWNMDTQ